MVYLTTIESNNNNENNCKYEMYGNEMVAVYEERVCVEEVARSIARMKQAQEEEDPFAVVNLDNVVERYERWQKAMPGVHPYYAVKCNSDPMLLRVLAECGAGFDCASKREIDMVLDNELVPADMIIYANPCKTRSYITHAYNRGVNVMTFDSEEELAKIQQYHPAAKLVLRISASDPTATCQLSIKFGCDPVAVAPQLLKIAAERGVDVIGISFHVGSGCNDPTAFAIAIAHCRALFDLGNQLGHKMTFLDLGGGFPGYDSDNGKFQKIADVINNALDKHFPPGTRDKIQMIAEPGRYFAAGTFSLATAIIAKTKVPASRITKNEEDEAKDGYMYYMNDGVYGSFNCIFFDHVHPTGGPLFHEPEDESDVWKTDALLWGPTCDGLDLVVPHCRLRRLNVGDWLYFANMGAYTCAAGSEFNGFPRPKLHYVISRKTWFEMVNKKLAGLTMVASPPNWEESPMVPDAKTKYEDDKQSMASSDSAIWSGVGSECEFAVY